VSYYRDFKISKTRTTEMMAEFQLIILKS